MLPQKSSAAATWITRLPPTGDVVPPAAVEQAVRAIEQAATSASEAAAIGRADDGDCLTRALYNENRFHFKLATARLGGLTFRQAAAVRPVDMQPISCLI